MNNKAKKAICRKEDLGNEASVEQFFVDRLLKRLGWSDSQIKTKESISELSINLGRKKIPYKPDYALSYRRKVRFVIDAKSTNLLSDLKKSISISSKTTSNKLTERNMIRRINAKIPNARALCRQRKKFDRNSLKPQ